MAKYRLPSPYKLRITNIKHTKSPEMRTVLEEVIDFINEDYKSLKENNITVLTILDEYDKEAFVIEKRA